MTPTPESTERARKWLMKQDQVNLALYAYAHAENGAVNSLALEFDRVKAKTLDAMVESFQSLIDTLTQQITLGHTGEFTREMLRDDLTMKRDKIKELRAQLVEHPRQGTAHDAEGGESETRTK